MVNTVLKIEGMSCPMCSGKVDEALKNVSGVTDVAVDLKKGVATVAHDNVKEEDLIAAVLDVGFRSKVKHGLFG
jgi:Copper chaperone